MPISRVKAYLKKWDLDSRVQEFDASSATVEEAALAVGCAPQRIAKTMSFLVEEKAILVVMAGDTKVDNTKYKTTFRQKATMVPGDRVLSLTGFPVGGVCPFDVPEGVAVYLDEALKRFDTVYPAAGSAHSAVGLTPAELEAVSKAAGWVDIAKLREA